MKEGTAIDRFGVRPRIEAASQRIRNHVRVTPLLPSASLSELAQARVFCKLENLQVTGSFKVRGAFNKILSLSHEQRSRGIVAASTGNHGAAVAYAAAKTGAPAIVFVPYGTSESKIANISRLGAQVRLEGHESGATERVARSFAEERGLTYVSPYNDWDVVAGQGTIGIEIADELKLCDAVVASMGGGGLIGGIGGYLKALNPRVRVIAASPKNSEVMVASLRAGRLIEVEHLPTLSDATAGGVEADTITFDLCRWVVDDCVEVTEEEIRSALRLFIEADHMLIEGSAAVACAALRRINLKDATIAVIICGANISADRLKAAL